MYAIRSYYGQVDGWYFDVATDRLFDRIDRWSVCRHGDGQSLRRFSTRYLYYGRLHPDSRRITSYNVCYTKLLRIGIPEKTVKALLTPHTHDYQLSSKVMGLENVIQRCYFFYPEVENVVEIHSEIGRGTEIVININTEVEPCIEL